MLGITPVTIFGDINGDGTVDIKDDNAVRARIGTTLRSTGSWSVAGWAARTDRLPVTPRSSSPG
jgi:hypothetical protein